MLQVGDWVRVKLFDEIDQGEIPKNILASIYDEENHTYVALNETDLLKDNRKGFMKIVSAAPDVTFSGYKMYELADSPWVYFSFMLEPKKHSPNVDRERLVSMLI